MSSFLQLLGTKGSYLSLALLEVLTSSFLTIPCTELTNLYSYGLKLRLWLFSSEPQWVGIILHPNLIYLEWPVALILEPWPGSWRVASEWWMSSAWKRIEACGACSALWVLHFADLCSTLCLKPLKLCLTFLWFIQDTAIPIQKDIVPTSETGGTRVSESNIVWRRECATNGPRFKCRTTAMEQRPLQRSVWWVSCSVAYLLLCNVSTKIIRSVNRRFVWYVACHGCQ